MQLITVASLVVCCHFVCRLLLSLLASFVAYCCRLLLSLIAVAYCCRLLLHLELCLSLRFACRLLSLHLELCLELRLLSLRLELRLLSLRLSLRLLRFKRLDFWRCLEEVDLKVNLLFGL
jgi:hypothetical protein